MKPSINRTTNHSVILKAVYKESEIPEFKNNPLIEALPPIPSNDDWFKILVNPVSIDESERGMPAHLCSHFILRLQDFYQPLPRHLDLATRIDQIIRKGYVGRNPDSPERAEILQKLYETGQKDVVQDVIYTDYQPISTISLIGASGVGKSTTTERVLGRYPQTLYHQEYGLHQIVWMKLDCPPDGSIKQLAMSFITELDRILQTDFHTKLPSKIGVDEILQEVKHLAVTYSLGILVIDEIQNLSVKKSGGRETMMNFFQELTNTLRVPIMLMGTMKAMRVLQLDFRVARRNTATGSFAWEPMKRDAAWSFFLESLWQYQWLKEPIPLTPELEDLLFSETQGIVAVLSTVFMMAQLRALRTGEKKLSEGLFKRVMKKDMAPIRPMLTALRSGDPRRIEKFDDIVPFDIDLMLKKEQLAILTGKINHAKQTKPVTSSPESKAILALETMGYDSDHAAESVLKAAQEGAKTQSKLVQYALNDLIGADDNSSKKIDEDTLDLRGYAEGNSVDGLREDGVIKGPAKE